jgi:alkylation response protein AidB-like acyl-CoA dehydrogenase
VGSQHQGIASMPADMATELDAARLLVWRAAWLSRNGTFENAEGSMSKLKAGRMAVWMTERATQILGGYGYVKEYPVVTAGPASGPGTILGRCASRSPLARPSIGDRRHGS